MIANTERYIISKLITTTLQIYIVITRQYKSTLLWSAAIYGKVKKNKHIVKEETCYLLNRACLKKKLCCLDLNGQDYKIVGSLTFVNSSR
jgi:hypothetical protein